MIELVINQAYLSGREFGKEMKLTGILKTQSYYQMG